MLSSAVIFVVFSVAAGVFNYLFQVVASSRMTAAEYAELNAWFAQLSIFLTVGGIFQYVGSFFPVSQKILRLYLVIMTLLAGLLLLWPATQLLTPMQWGVLVVISAVSFSWVMGQIQNRMMYYTLAIISVLSAATKLGVGAMNVDEANRLNQFIFAIFISVYPGMLVALIMGWWTNSKVARLTEHHSFKALWTAPLVMSFITTMIPQIDILILHQTQESTAFESFVRAGLFGRGVFYAFLIFAQWWLPKQMRRGRGAKTAPLVKWFYFPVIPIGALIVTLLGPFVNEWIMHWADYPSSTLVFLTCWNMGALTWIYLLIQEACATGKPNLGLKMSVGLVSMAGIQYILKLNVQNYLLLSLLLLHLIILSFPKLIRAKN